jgi:hypothetical protein
MAGRAGEMIVTSMAATKMQAQRQAMMIAICSFGAVSTSFDMSSGNAGSALDAMGSV